MKPSDIFAIARAVAPCVKGHYRCVAGHAIDIQVLGMVEETIRTATNRERARCKALVLDIYDGAPDAGTVPMSEIAEMARKIEEGGAA